MLNKRNENIIGAVLDTSIIVAGHLSNITLNEEWLYIKINIV
jgi:hypothetical protein